MDLVSPLSDVVVASPPDDSARNRAERLAAARNALLDSAPPVGRSYAGRKARRRFLEIRPRVLRTLERVVERGSDRHVWLMLDAVALLTAPDGNDVGGADEIIDGLKGDTALYDDGDEWTGGVQQVQMLPIWMLGMCAAGFFSLVHWIGKPDPTYWQAMLGGLIGCFLDWNRSEPRKLSGHVLHRLLLRTMQPLASAL